MGFELGSRPELLVHRRVLDLSSMCASATRCMPTVFSILETGQCVHGQPARQVAKHSAAKKTGPSPVRPTRNGLRGLVDHIHSGIRRIVKNAAACDDAWWRAIGEGVNTKLSMTTFPRGAIIEHRGEFWPSSSSDTRRQSASNTSTCNAFHGYWSDMAISIQPDSTALVMCISATRREEQKH